MRADKDGGMGLSRDKAAALTGMLQGESGPNLDPKVYNPNDAGGPSGGTAQWHDKFGETNGRLTQLKRYAIERKGDWKSVEIQQQFWKHEAQNGERAAWNKIQAAPDGPSALRAGIYEYERPAQKEHEYRTRLSNYERLKSGEFDRAPEPFVPAAKRMAEAADKLKGAAMDQGRAAAIQRRDAMGERPDRMSSAPQAARPEIAPMPKIAPEPRQPPPGASPRDDDPAHVHVHVSQDGRVRSLRLKPSPGVQISLRTGPQMVEVS